MASQSLFSLGSELVSAPDSRPFAAICFVLFIVLVVLYTLTTMLCNVNVKNASFGVVCMVLLLLGFLYLIYGSTKDVGRVGYVGSSSIERRLRITNFDNWELTRLISSVNPRSRRESVHGIVMRGDLDEIEERLNNDNNAKLSPALKGAPGVRVAFVCGVHSREPITTSVCMEIIREILYTHKYRELILQNRLSVMVVPLAGPGGRDMALKTNLCYRRNSGGVDLNRNWPIISVYKNLSGPANADAGEPLREVNPGPFPFSEFENRFLDRILLNSIESRRIEREEWLKNETGTKNPLNKKEEAENGSHYDEDMFEWEFFGCPDAMVHIHSGGFGVFYPYDAVLDPPKREPLLKRVSSYIANKHCPNCMVGSSSMLMRTSLGTMADYVEEMCEPTINLTWEIYFNASGTQSPNESKCFSVFNPVEESDYSATVSQWSYAAATLIDTTMILCENTDTEGLQPCKNFT